MAEDNSTTLKKITELSNTFESLLSDKSTIEEALTGKYDDNLIKSILSVCNQGNKSGGDGDNLDKAQEMIDSNNNYYINLQVVFDKINNRQGKIDAFHRFNNELYESNNDKIIQLLEKPPDFFIETDLKNVLSKLRKEKKNS